MERITTIEHRVTVNGSELAEMLGMKSAGKQQFKVQIELGSTHRNERYDSKSYNSEDVTLIITTATSTSDVLEDTKVPSQ